MPRLRRKRFEQWAPSQPHTPLPVQSFRIDDRIAGYLLGSDEIDSHLLPYTEYVAAHSSIPCPILSDDFRNRLLALPQRTKDRAILYFRGPSGIGKQEGARTLSDAAGRGLLTIDLEGLANADHATFEDVIRRVAREARLLTAALYCRGFAALLPDEKHFARGKLLAELRNLDGLSFLEAETAWEPSAQAAIPFISVKFSSLAFAERVRLWASVLPTALQIGLDLEAIASKFRFSGDQIRDGAATAANLALWRDPEDPRITENNLYESCRLHSNKKLASLARRIKPRHGWDDIILPPDRARHLREICNSVKHRALVYEKWGFDRKLSLGKGLNILFAGPPGTGKTMGAEIMAGELGLDLQNGSFLTGQQVYRRNGEKSCTHLFGSRGIKRYPLLRRSRCAVWLAYRGARFARSLREHRGWLSLTADGRVRWRGDSGDEFPQEHG